MKALVRRALRKSRRPVQEVSEGTPAAETSAEEVRGIAYSEADFRRFRSMILRGDLGGLSVSADDLVTMARHMDRMKVDDAYELGEILTHHNQTIAVAHLRRLALGVSL